MSNATLELSEHELYFLLPGTPATAPATRVEVEMDGELRVFLVRWESPRLELEDSERLYLFYQEVGTRTGIFCSNVYDKSGNFAALPPEKKQKSLKRKLLDKSYKFRRYWRAPDSSLGIAFYTDGRAKVFRLDKKLEEMEFCWDNVGENELKQWSQIKFLAFCRQLYATDDSPLNYVLRWVSLTSQQKDEIAFGCVNYDWDTMRRLLTLAQKMIIFISGRFPYYREDISLWRFDCPWPEGWEFGQPWSEPLRWSTRISNAIYKIIQPSFRPEDTICHHSWRHGNLDSYKLCEVECGPPTAHEALEAQLELREFLRLHLSDDEIEALMRAE